MTNKEILHNIAELCASVVKIKINEQKSAGLSSDPTKRCVYITTILDFGDGKNIVIASEIDYSDSDAYGKGEDEHYKKVILNLL